MSWIKFETATSDKPEVWQISTLLSIDPDAVVGKLLRVWAWFDSHTVNGNAPTVTKTLLDAHVRVTGFCDAMIECGWMISENGSIQLPNFDRHNGKTAKTRVLTAKRVAENRASNGGVTTVKQICNDASVTPALPKEEKNRKENINPPVVPQGGTPPAKPPKGKKPKDKYDISTQEYPPHLDNPEFRSAWAEWVGDLQARYSLTPRAGKAQFRSLAEMNDSAAAIRCIHEALGAQWKSVFPKPSHFRSIAQPQSPQPAPPRQKTQEEKDAQLAQIRAQRAMEDAKRGA